MARSFFENICFIQILNSPSSIQSDLHFVIIVDGGRGCVTSQGPKTDMSQSGTNHEPFELSSRFFTHFVIMKSREIRALSVLKWDMSRPGPLLVPTAIVLLTIMGESLPLNEDILCEN